MNPTFSLDSLFSGLFGGGAATPAAPAGPDPMQQWFGDWKTFSPSELPWAPETPEFWDTLTGRAGKYAQAPTDPAVQTGVSTSFEATPRPTMLGPDPMVPAAEPPTFTTTPSPTEMPDGSVAPQENALFAASPDEVYRAHKGGVEIETALVARSSIAGEFRQANTRLLSGGHAEVASPGGARFHVSSQYSSRFAGLVADLEAHGVTIDAKQSGGYADRNIAGTNIKSRHAYGEAIDINWNENGRGNLGAISKKLPPEVINSLAQKHGLKWGGVWKNPDPMHFEVDHRIKPVSFQGSDGAAPRLTAYSPQGAGRLKKMEGGYAAARPGPDGKAVVRTLEDHAAGGADYITLAGDPSQYGQEYVIPKIEWIDSKGQKRVSENVRGVVHDTGRAFKGAGNSRFDIPVARDLTDKQMNMQPFLRGGVKFHPLKKKK